MAVKEQKIIIHISTDQTFNVTWMDVRDENQ